MSVDRTIRPTAALDSLPLSGGASREVLETIINSIADPIFVKDQEHRWVLVNDALCAMLGHSREALIGKSDYDYFPEDEAHVFWEKDEEVFASGLTNVNEEQLTDSSGQTRTIVTKKSVFEDEDGTRLLVGVIRDISEIKTAQSALKEARDELERRVEERTEEVRQTQELLLQSQKMDAIGKMAGGIAHDFNNLFAVVQASLELIMLRGSEDTHLTELTEQALSAITRGSSLTQRMLAFSRKQTLRPEVINVVQALRDAETLLRRSLGVNHTLAYTCDIDHIAAEVDPGQLEAAIINLALNARDAMPDGGTINIRSRPVEVVEGHLDDLREVTPGPYVLIEVQDTGSGISPQHIDKIFEPFYTTKPIGQGTGLGLSTVFGFAKQTGGTVTVSSLPNKGATFRLYIPRVTDLHLLPQTPANPIFANPISAGKSVLLVEDDPSVRTMTALFLRALGFQVHSAPNAAAARDEAHEMGRVDVLLTDLILGDNVNGRQLALDLLATNPNLKPIYMTGYTDDVLREELENDNTPLLTKPFRLAKLEKILSDVLIR